MKIKLFQFLKFFLPFTIVLLLLQYVATTKFLEVDLYYGVFSIYAFHFLSTLIVYLLLLYVQQNFQDKTGFAFMGSGVVKMLAAIVFLLPLLLAEVANTFASVMVFFIPYFLFLGFETIFAVRLINLK